MGEFDLIERYFKSASKPHTDRDNGVDLGIGDDCALITPQPGMQLAISCDMLVEGRHFLSTVNPEALGHKALAVNLSDLAACGAQPLGFTLALSMPRVDEAWLAGFSGGLLALADLHNCALIGGDTTAGPLNICITVFGQMPKGSALLRSGAKVGDDIYVSGTPGEARVALEIFRGNISASQAIFEATRQRMERPTPRVALGIALRGIASSCIDVSDGLLGDLGHILTSSCVGAQIELDAIDSIANYSAWISGSSEFSLEFSRRMVLAGGDDYELCFNAPPAQREAINTAAAHAQVAITRIGKIRSEAGVMLLDAEGKALSHDFESFDHFKA
jgi:thiamine-monophosphate kinase